MEAIRLKVACSVVCVHLVMCSISSIEHEFMAVVVVLVQFYCFNAVLVFILVSIISNIMIVFRQKLIAQETRLEI